MSSTILDKIIVHKRREVAQSKANISVSDLERFPAFGRGTLSLRQRLLDPDSTGIIAEFKRKSPSKGIINDKVRVADVTRGYAQAGAAGLSVLTDEEFFFGTSDDLRQARAVNPTTPILRKEFVIDEYQLWEAKAWGADVVLLIAACLTPDEVARLSRRAHELGLEVLLEVHDEDELARSLTPHIDLVGVNNRNLKTFTVGVDVSLELAERIPADFVKVSESGLGEATTIQRLHEVGYRGFLIGESFMKTPRPAEALTELVEALKTEKLKVAS
jgi:indole-3-glycerol phosphate synthase